MNKFLAKVVLEIIERVATPLMRWASRQIIASRGESATVSAAVADHYVLPDESITPLVILAAYEKFARLMEENPEREQARLNACLESIRSQAVFGRLAGFIASLVRQGVPMDEVMLRLSANMLMLGMILAESTSVAEGHAPQLEEA